MSNDPIERHEEPTGIEAVFAAWALRVEEGEALDFDALAREHPDLEPELRRLHEDWQLFAPLLGKAVSGLLAQEPGSALPSLTGGPDADDDAPSAALLARLGIHAPSEGRYRFRSVIGRGGGGVVLKVWDAKLNRPLAMKVVLGRGEDRPTGQTPQVDGRTLSRFVDEARIASQLNHPGIVPVHELSTDENGRAFFTMKLVKGQDLSRVFEKVRTGTDGWNPTRALTVLLRVCEAMAYAHDKGVIHRDLKPANVMVGPYGEVYVMDWGLARVLGEPDRCDVRIRSAPGGPMSAVDSFRRGDREATPDSSLVTMDGSVIGTPSYMAPEQAKGEIEAVGTRSDVYAVGAMLYELIGGEPPYAPREARLPAQVVLTNVLHGPPRRVEELAPRAAPELVAICEKAMLREAAERYGSMRELAADLGAYLEGRVVAAYETGTWAETRKWVRRNRPLAGAAALILLLLCGGLATTLALKSLAEERTVEERSSRYIAAVTSAEAFLGAMELANSRRALALAPTELRDWEWEYLSARADESLYRLEALVPVGRVDDGQGQLAISSDGLRMATVSEDGAIDIWETRSGKHIRRLHGPLPPAIVADGPTPAGCVAFSADGLFVATVSGEHGGAIWRTATGERAMTLAMDAPVDSSIACAFSPDGSRLLVVADGSLGVFETATGQRNFVTESAPQAAHAMSGRPGRPRLHGAICHSEFSHDGTRVLVGTGGPNAYVLDPADGAVQHVLRGPTAAVPFATFSPDDSRIITCSWRGSFIWDAQSGSFIGPLDAGSSTITSAAFSPDGTQVVTASSDGKARVWNTATRELRDVVVGHEAGLNGVSFSADGKQVVTAANDTSARVWDAVTLRQVAVLTGHESRAVTFATFVPGGRFMLTAGAEGEVRLWAWPQSSDAWRPALTVNDHKVGLEAGAFSRDGNRLAIAIGSEVHIADAHTRRSILQLVGHTGAVNDVCFSTDETQLATASDDGTVAIWDARVGSRQLSMQASEGAVRSARFSADGRTVVTASEEGVVATWDAASGQRTLVIECEDAVRVTLSPDRSGLLTIGDELRLWRVDTGALVRTMTRAEEEYARARFNGDGSAIVAVTASGEVEVWDAESGEFTFALVGHTDVVRDACFIPGGTRIATAADDGAVRIWDSRNGRMITRIARACGWHAWLACSEDGSRIMTKHVGASVSILDSVAPSARHQWQLNVADAGEQAKGIVDELIASSTSLLDVAARLYVQVAPDSVLFVAARNELGDRAESARLRVQSLTARRAERTWLRRLLGVEPWPDESMVAAQLKADPSLPRDGYSLYSMAWEIVDPAARKFGDEVQALALARMALDDGRVREWACRDTLARAFLVLGRFDESLAEQQRALDAAPPADMAAYQERLQALRDDIMQWRDPQGRLKDEDIYQAIASLEAEIERLASDTEVQLWLHFLPGKADGTGRGSRP